MMKVKKMLSRIINENVIIVTAGKKPNWILFQGKLSCGCYQKLINSNLRWLKLDVVHVAPGGNKLQVSVKKL